MKKVTFREIYYIKEHFKYHFYEWIEDIGNKDAYYEEKTQIIMGSPYDKNTIYQMYKKELQDLEDMERISKFNKNGIQSKKIKEIEEKIDDRCKIDNYKKQLENLVDNQSNYFKEIKITYGRKSIFETSYVE